MRLLYTPLVRSLESIVGYHPFSNTWTPSATRSRARFVSALTSPAGRTSPRIGAWKPACSPRYRVSAPGRICQAELAERYDHKHQKLSPRDPEKGLHRMATDVAKCIFRTVAAEGIKLDAGLFDPLLSAYKRKAEDTCRYYAADAAINGLTYDSREEKMAVATFVRSIRMAADAYLRDPLGRAFDPELEPGLAALPDFLNELREAVRLDNES